MARSKTKTQSPVRSTVTSWLQLALLRSEKAELAEAKVAYTFALEAAKKQRNAQAQMEAIAGLLRLASEALDTKAIATYTQELDRFVDRYERLGKQVPSLVWYCKGVVASQMTGSQTEVKKRNRESQLWLYRYIKLQKPGSAEWVKGWIAMSVAQLRKNSLLRARSIAESLHFSQKGSQGIVALVLASIAERENKVEEALRWLHMANGQFLAEHQWYYHLYVLYSHARLHRIQRNFSQAYQFLELVSQAATKPEFGFLRNEIEEERKRLETDAVDLLIDARSGTIRTRESGEIIVGKQYVLMEILEALADAAATGDSGLSKADIIQKVWGQDYRPEAHDNKLYYNINRLRKLIEPDAKQPKYLVNWREGYRLGPGLKVQKLLAPKTEILKKA